MIKSLVLTVSLTLAVSACANKATKSLPKCTGQDRRPMNADLWDWRKDKPAGTTHVKLLNKFTPENREVESTAVLAFNEVLPQSDAPQWNIEASHKNCE